MRTALLLLAASALWAATPVLDVKSQNYNPSSASVICTTTGVTAGDGILLGVSTFVVGTTVTVSDGTANTYTRIVLDSSGARQLFIYKVENSVGGTLTTTVTFNQGEFGTCIMLAYKNVISSSITDGITHNNGVTGPPDPGGFTTTNANDVIVGFAYTSTGAVTPATGYTLQQTAGNAGSVQLNAEDKGVSATGTYDPSWTTTLTPVWVAAGVALKGTSPGGAKPCTITLLGAGVC